MTLPLDELFDRAAAMQPHDREPWLRAQCEGHPNLLAQALSLLAADSRAGAFLEAPPAQQMADAAEAIADEIARRQPKAIGPYDIERLLGAGGMGEVYLARRRGKDFDQRVALKLLRGIPTAELLRRFAQERRVLASLTHPHIAPLIDGGATEHGVPYFVMPYIDGAPLDTYCRAHKLGPHAVMQLLLPVLDAVEHAHQRLVVHRDLKPANVLVDTDGHPTVLDFGIAKVLSEQTIDATRTGRQLLTPMYASPEQIRGEAIGTAADIFSLGVMLYELVTGRHPWAAPERSPLELAQRICETEPLPPSRARPSSTTDARLSHRAFWSDLDAVILTAIRKEPSRRYASVSRLADDLRRVLAGRAVAAQPDTLGYRTSRFLRRHRFASSAAAVAVVSMMAGTGVSLWQADRASDASRRYRAQLEQTELRSRQLRDLATTLVFDIYDSVATLDGADEARLRLTQSGADYLDHVAEQFADDPAVVIELIRAYVRLADVQGLRTIGSVGDTEGALVSSGKALSLAATLQAMPGAPEDAPMLLAMAQRVRGDLYRTQNRLHEALDAYRAGILAAEQMTERLPADPRGSRNLASLLLQLGFLEHRLGRPSDALRTYASARAAINRSLELTPGHDDSLRDLGITLRREGDLLLASGDIDQAEARHLEAMQLFTDLAEADPLNRQHQSSIALQHERLGDCALRRGNHTRATHHYEATHAMNLAELKANPSDQLVRERVSISYEKLADIGHAMGDYERAASASAEASRLADEVADGDPSNARLMLDALYIRGKAAAYAAAAGDANAADSLEAVAARARELSVLDPDDPYPAEIEVEALIARLDASGRQIDARTALTEAIDRHAVLHANAAWLARAREALKRAAGDQSTPQQ
ncbi:MAG: protein kinase domain-containing protein [Phycisphaerales bacterium]